jgi:hypothetical protein
MARPVIEAGAIEIIEEAIHALRGAGVRACALIWTGAIPFALGVLLFWRDMTHFNRTAERCAWESILLVGLLLWLNLWRGMFAARINGQLAGAPATGSGGIPHGAGVHLLLGNSKLLLLPLAVLAVLPIPGAVAFFRIATVVAAVDHSDFLKTWRRARKLAASVAQPVLLLLLLVFIGTLLLANIAVTLALLPQLARILTGYESSFTRAGFRLLADPSFYVVAGVVTWLALEPLVQAVYTVAAFHAESKETGADVRVRFRALVRSGSIAALLLCVTVLNARPGLDASQFDHSIKQTLASPEYAWNNPTPKAAGQESWFVRFTDSLGASLSRVKAAIGRGVDRVMEWFRKMFEAPSTQRPGPPASGAIRGELYLALALALLAAALLIWRGRVALARKHELVTATPQTVSLAAENVTADQLPEQDWYRLADECFSNSQFRLGLRALYLANLAGLAQDKWIAIHPGKTNHEYETELFRRARAYPEACDRFHVNVELFERVWYGDYAVSSDDCQAFRARAAEMKRDMAAAGVSA